VFARKHPLERLPAGPARSGELVITPAKMTIVDIATSGGCCPGNLDFADFGDVITAVSISTSMLASP
jgi:hypothetical protein